jgi:hypothetical protein
MKNRKPQAAKTSRTKDGCNTKKSKILYSEYFFQFMTFIIMAGLHIHSGNILSAKQRHIMIQFIGEKGRK